MPEGKSSFFFRAAAPSRRKGADEIMEIKTELSLMEKLHILADAAKYDVACTSSGVDRKGKQGYLGNSAAAGICHSFAADGRCISLLKILLTNYCVYDCKYCVNRCSNDAVRTAFTPREICRLVTEFYKRNYIEGLFLSSGVWKTPAHTMEQMCRTLYLLRTEYKFNGYIHVKAIPGAPQELLAAAGYLADRMSINLELPTGESLKKLAPSKSHHAILKPMRMMSDTIAQHRLALGKSAQLERSAGNRFLEHSIFSEGGRFRAQELPGAGSEVRQPPKKVSPRPPLWQELPGRREGLALPAELKRADLSRPFAPAGQSTQVIIGATPESDYQLLKTTQYLYQSYDLKRVFFSAYIPLNADGALPPPGTPVALLREHRLYQADWLLRFYGFSAEELLSPERPDFNELLDPKCEWALRHLELFPVEISRAKFDMLLRIPGIGPKSAQRILASRKYGSLDFEALKKMGVVLKRAHYFITCQGKMLYKTPVEEQYITRQLTAVNEGENWRIRHENEAGFRQLSLFDDFHVQ